MRWAMPTVLALAVLACTALPWSVAAQEPSAAQELETAPEPARGKPAKRAAKPRVKPPADPSAPPPAAPQPPPPPALSLDAYAEAAATTIIAEQACPGVRLNAGQLTNLRLAARVGAGQESVLEEKLRGRAAELRQRLAADGREAWCAGALDAFGPAGTVARAVLTAGTTR